VLKKKKFEEKRKTQEKGATRGNQEQTVGNPLTRLQKKNRRDTKNNSRPKKKSNGD